MGGAMAARFLAAGYVVHGTSRTRTRADHLVADGLDWHDTPREVAASTDVVFTSVPDDRALEDVATGEDGLVAGLGRDATWVEMSTVSPDASRTTAVRARARGATMLDAPVSGSVPQAEAGTLTIMVGGTDDAYRCAEPLLLELGTPTHVGPNGHGLVVKFAINISLAAQMLAFAEGLLLADRSGVARDRVLSVMTQSAIGSPLLKGSAAIVFDLPDTAFLDLRLMHKDIELALAAARRLEIPLPTADRADEVLETARSIGYEQRDLAALYEVLEHMAPARTRAA